MKSQTQFRVANIEATEPKTVGLAALVVLMQSARNRFISVVWESDHSKSKGFVLNRFGTKNPFWKNKVTKRYAVTARNDFSFQTSFRNFLARLGLDLLADNFQAKARAWGHHVRGKSPFVAHTDKAGQSRLHGHLQIAFKPAPRNVDMTASPKQRLIRAYYGMKQCYWNNDELGYYIDGVKATEEENDILKSFKKASTDDEMIEGMDVQELADFIKSKKFHPVNCRLENIMYIKVSGHWYKLDIPVNNDEVARVANEVEELANN